MSASQRIRELELELELERAKHPKANTENLWKDREKLSKRDPEVTGVGGVFWGLFLFFIVLPVAVLYVSCAGLQMLAH